MKKGLSILLLIYLFNSSSTLEAKNNKKRGSKNSGKGKKKPKKISELFFKPEIVIDKKNTEILPTENNTKIPQNNESKQYAEITPKSIKNDLRVGENPKKQELMGTNQTDKDIAVSKKGDSIPTDQDNKNIAISETVLVEIAKKINIILQSQAGDNDKKNKIRDLIIKPLTNIDALNKLKIFYTKKKIDTKSKIKPEYCDMVVELIEDRINTILSSTKEEKPFNEKRQISEEELKNQIKESEKKRIHSENIKKIDQILKNTQKIPEKIIAIETIIKNFTNEETLQELLIKFEKNKNYSSLKDIIANRIEKNKKYKNEDTWITNQEATIGKHKSDLVHQANVLIKEILRAEENIQLLLPQEKNKNYISNKLKKNNLIRYEKDKNYSIEELINNSIDSSFLQPTISGIEQTKLKNNSELSKAYLNLGEKIEAFKIEMPKIIAKLKKDIEKKNKDQEEEKIIEAKIEENNSLVRNIKEVKEQLEKEIESKINTKLQKIFNTANISINSENKDKEGDIRVLYQALEKILANLKKNIYEVLRNDLYSNLIQNKYITEIKTKEIKEKLIEKINNIEKSEEFKLLEKISNNRSNNIQYTKAEESIIKKLKKEITTEKSIVILKELHRITKSEEYQKLKEISPIVNDMIKKIITNDTDDFIEIKDNNGKYINLPYIYKTYSHFLNKKDANLIRAFFKQYIEKNTNLLMNIKKQQQKLSENL